MVLCTIIDGNIYFTTSIFLIVYYVLYVIVVVTGSYIRILKTKPSRTFSCTLLNFTTVQILHNLNELAATTQGGELDDELSLEEATEHPTIFTTLSPHVITEEIDDDYFGLPMDLPSTVSSHPQRPGSPILGEYSLPRRISAVSSADSTAPQFSPVLSAHLKGAVQSLRNYVYGEGSIRLPENDEESSIQNTDDFVLLPLTDTANGDVPSSSHNSWLMEIYQILFPCLYFWNTLGLWERVYAVLTLPSDFIFSLVTPVISRIVLENLRKEEHNHGYVNLDGDSSPLLGREDTEIMDDADGEHPARLSIVMVRIQLAIGPFFANWIVADGSIDSWMGALVASIVLSILGNVCMLYISLHRTAFLLAIFGFVMSVLEIYYISNILVALIKVIGIVFCINQTLLGLTVLAVGNSLLDLIANANIARLGMPVMAMGASYGSPMLSK